MEYTWSSVINVSLLVLRCVPHLLYVSTLPDSHFLLSDRLDIYHISVMQVSYSNYVYVRRIDQFLCR